MTQTVLSQRLTTDALVKVTMYSSVSPVSSGLSEVAPPPFEELWRAATLIEDAPRNTLSVREVAYQLETLNNLLTFCSAVVAPPAPTTLPAPAQPARPGGVSLRELGLAPAPFGALYAPEQGVTNRVARLILSSPLLVYVGMSEAIAGALIMLVNRVNAARRAWNATNLAIHRDRLETDLESDRIALQRDIIEVARDTLRDQHADLFETPAGDRLVQLGLTGLANIDNVEPLTEEEADRLS